MFSIFFLASLVLTAPPDVDASANVINTSFTPSVVPKHGHLSSSSVMTMGLRVWKPWKVWDLIGVLKKGGIRADHELSGACQGLGNSVYKVTELRIQGEIQQPPIWRYLIPEGTQGDFTPR